MTDTAASKLLLRATHQGDRHQCQTLIIEGGADVNYQNEGGETALHIACEVGGRYAVMELLLGFDADPNIATTSYLGSYTPLHVATKKQMYLEAQLLLDKEANANIADKKGRLPLHYAAERGDLQMCRLLILGGNSVYTATDTFGDTPHSIAKAHNHMELAKWLANPRNLETSDLPPLRDEESRVIVINHTTLGLNARLK